MGVDETARRSGRVGAGVVSVAIGIAANLVMQGGLMAAVPEGAATPFPNATTLGAGYAGDQSTWVVGLPPHMHNATGLAVLIG